MKLPFRLYARSVMKGQPSNYFACSKKAGEWLFGQEIASTKELTVLNNAVNVEEFGFNQIDRMKVRRELKARDSLVIGHIGRFNKQKNHEFMIDIFKEVHEKLPNAILVLVGEGHLRVDIEKKVKKIGLEENVRFLGVRKDIANLMQGFDLFLFPSLFEGLPVVLVEAQAAGLNCIVSDTITTETNVTGRLNFLSLNDPPSVWADTILSTSYGHEETAEILREKGYDTVTMAKWLTGYYVGQAFSSKESLSFGGVSHDANLNNFYTDL
ncbi:glycosyltransferase [Anaerobacillus sp. CMMVII]|uniref:glycosyltransferase n=1 Tax=Anaerobacillus sp. CMMVII TaxID=2755588 RepID=UPI0021B7C131|nr:glycosyltransferase [Anaerobacillus sp. CMMVII]